MGLFQRRQRDRQKATLVAAGETVSRTSSFPEPARVKLIFALFEHFPDDIFPTHLSSSDKLQDFIKAIHYILLREWGRSSLAPAPAKDAIPYFVQHKASDKDVLDVIESYFTAIKWMQEKKLATPVALKSIPQASAYRDAINDILDEFNIDYQLFDERMIERSAGAMYANALEPALALLQGHSRFQSTEVAFQKALRELRPDGDPADAITDVGTALQEALKTLGCKGNQLSDLLKDAEKKDILGPYDTKLAQGARLIGEWVSADRSVRGDTHNAHPASSEDAWLAVNVVGALIRRLAARSAGA